MGGMAYDSNRGRDLPRALQFKPIKGKPKSEQIGDPIKLAKRRETVIKALAKATHGHGFNTLMPGAAALTEKQKQKEHELVLEALALGLNVHSGMLALHRLTLQTNPNTNGPRP